jgi:UDP-3-O-[3-hydroxymyristoyl] glucosamine N-acyltransferase
MSKNIFFKSKGPFKLNILFPNQSNSKINIEDIKTLDKAEKFDITFFESLNYKDLAEKTKASSCITKESLKKYLPKFCEPICVKEVLFELAKVVSKFYPNADLDYPDKTLEKPKITKISWSKIW